MRVALLAGLALALAPVAQAQVGCDLVNRIVTSSKSGFADIRGDEISAGWYDAKIYMGGADDCTVDVGKDQVFDCVWEEEGEPSARTWVSALDLAVGKCLPDWTRSVMSGSSFNNLSISNGAAYRKEAVSIEIHGERVGSEALVWFRVIASTPAGATASVAPVAAPAAAVASAPPPTTPADVTSPTPANIDRAPLLTNLDLRYFNQGAGYVEFIELSQLTRVGTRAYVWVLTARDRPLAGAWGYLTLREVACGVGPQMRYIHSVHLGEDYLPNGTSVVNTSSKFTPGKNDDVQTIIDVACHGAKPAGVSYTFVPDAAANRKTEAQGG